LSVKGFVRYSILVCDLATDEVAYRVYSPVSIQTQSLALRLNGNRAYDQLTSCLSQTWSATFSKTIKSCELVYMQLCGWVRIVRGAIQLDFGTDPHLDLDTVSFFVLGTFKEV